MPEQGPSNWDRWGPEDELGTLNLVTPEATLRGASLVREGRFYSLAVPLEREGPIWPTRNRTIHISTYHNRPGPEGPGGAEDFLIMHTHGTTHVDSLAHVWYGGQLYNGHDAENVSSRGTLKNAIYNVKGIVTRGVMLDVAALRGMDHLEKGYAVTPADLEACEERQGVRVESGDVLLIRTGWLRVFGESRDEFDSGEPGPGMAAASWFHERGVTAVGADNSAVEVMPSEMGQGLPLHRNFIRDQGGYLMELLNLEELARDGVQEFLFVAAPLRIVRGLGSPLNPLAIV